MSQSRRIPAERPQYQRRDDGDRLSHFWRKTLTHRGRMVVGAAATAAAVAVTGTLAVVLPGASLPTTYTTPRGVVVPEPYDFTPFPGQTITDPDVRGPIDIGVGRVYDDINGLPTTQRIMYLGATVTPEANGGADVDPLTGDQRTVPLTQSELVNGPITISLDGHEASVTVGYSPTHAGALAVSFSSQPGVEFPQSQPVNG